MIHMEGIKGGGGGRVVGVGEDHDMGEYGMHQCIDHPHHRNNTPSGGICAFCLQEKLGKLVSSSFPLPIQPSSSLSSPPSSSSPPSFRSNTATAPSSSITVPTATSALHASTSSLSLSVHPKKNNGSDHHCNEYYMRSRLPFLLAKKKKKPSTNSSSSSSSAPATSDIIFKRSKSTATPRRENKFLDDADDDIVIEDFSPRKRNGFWSFLYLSSKPSPSSSMKKLDAKSFRDSNGTPRISASTSSGLMSTVKPREKCMVGSSSSLGRKSDTTVVEEGDNVSGSAGSSFERKVSRSRSVGCGSRSFSGDFFERISNGFGDCTLRRVESQREGNRPYKVAASAGGAIVNRGGDHHHHHCMKERVRCGGIFGGFMMMTNPSSYWVSSSGGDDGMNGRARSWGWAFASPMRAFSSSKASSKDNKNDKNATPDLQAIPSLLTVRG